MRTTIARTSKSAPTTACDICGRTLSGEPCSRHPWAGTLDLALANGVVKMNVDTDTQWAYWDGIKKFYQGNEGFLQGQIGNPKGPDQPNKSYYDPRKWVREAETSMVVRVKESCSDLKNTN